jgi:hypothetical protein
MQGSQAPPPGGEEAARRIEEGEVGEDSPSRIRQKTLVALPAGWDKTGCDKTGSLHVRSCANIQLRKE